MKVHAIYINSPNVVAPSEMNNMILKSILKLITISATMHECIISNNTERTDFRVAGYTAEMFDAALSNAQGQSRQELFYRELAMPTTEASPILLKTTFGVGMPIITKIMRKHSDTLCDFK